MSEAEPYFTTYGELVEGQQYRFNVDNSWATRGIGSPIAAGRFVQALPLPPKPVMVEVEAGLLARLVDDSEERDSFHEECHGGTGRYYKVSLDTSVPLDLNERQDLRDAMRAAARAPR